MDTVGRMQMRQFRVANHAQEWDRLSVPEDTAMFSDTTAFGPRMARHEWQMLLDRWQRLQPYADQFATAFFDTLFSCEPEFAHWFGSATLEAQFLRFAHLLTEIVPAEDDPEELDHRIEQIVQRYARDDSATGQSRAVRAAITAMLLEVEQVGLTPQMRADWRSASSAVNGMLRGTRWQPARPNGSTILQTALRAELAADRRAPSIDEFMESTPDAEAA